MREVKNATSTNARNEATAEAMQDKMQKATEKVVTNILDRAAEEAFNPMKIGAIIEENAKSSKIDHNIQELMLEYISDLESYYHKELYESEEEVEPRVAMLYLAKTVLFLGYGIGLRLNNMIDSEHQFALDMATFHILNQCKKYISSKEYLEYLKKHNIAFIQDDDHIIIQLLTGTFSSVGGYEYGHMLSVDGACACLDPSMKGWDMIIFLMYT